MDAHLIQEIVEAISTELDSDDLRNLSFYEGAFYVFADQQRAGRLDKNLLHSYLSEFLNEDWIMRDILEKENPQLLSELEDLVPETANAGV